MASSIFHIKEHVLSTAHIREYARATGLSQDDELLQHVKQYTPKDNPNPRKGDVTIIGAHANAFPKELYEPLWENLHREAKACGVRIRTILIADAAWQGQSGLLNESKLGNDPSWHDYHRDILHMINILRPPRPLVGMGHSFGAVTLANVALASPRLFSTLVLMDPASSSFEAAPIGRHGSAEASTSLRRRDLWPSRAQAAASFTRSPFFRTWDPRVLDLYVRYGLHPTSESDPDGEVRLTTTKHQEVFTFSRPSWHAYDAEGRNPIDDNDVRVATAPDLPHHAAGSGDDSFTFTWPFYRPEQIRSIRNLAHIRPSVLYVFALMSSLSGPEQREEKMRLTGSGNGGSGGAKNGRVKAVLAENNGHLVPMEDPAMCAREAASWISREMERWWAEERQYEEWTRKPYAEKACVTDEFKEWTVRGMEHVAKANAKL
ncbi:hypothetical protein GMORB2_0806 [Geosmithia morbida]|uniref:AB hydrolase-1 domain-containing protein n=1 Tax=Geosmithia morbida TaxID=1094350 RepID=A0A9P4YZU1_9HYPO|nr:uncharacterized protein GMORB2_0806 [Geosmithia morbida]KAF4125562.1 hypothetical protein GMORB2_0806 [Geosmithia morbida]